MTQQYTTATSDDIGRGNTTGGPSRVDIDTAVVTPTDRVRWGPILAGLFTALSTLAVLGVLGAAIAGSAYDPGDSARAFGIGAGIWGVLSMLVAFGLGGWVAARSAAVRGHNWGLLNGAMVWAVAIPLLAYLAATSAARVADTAAQAMDNAAASAQQAGAQVMGDGQSAGAEAQPAAGSIPPSQSQSSQNQERAADATARTAWSTLIALLLGLSAAAAGGYAGARTANTMHARPAGA